MSTQYRYGIRMNGYDSRTREDESGALYMKKPCFLVETGLLSPFERLED
jgi:hypothetical protein